MERAWPQLERWLLGSLLASVAVAAVVGSVGVLLGDFGVATIRMALGVLILAGGLGDDLVLPVGRLTVLILAGAMACGFGAGAALRAGRSVTVPRAALVLTAVATVLSLVAVWGGSPWSPTFVRITVTSWGLAAALGHLSLLSLARLPPLVDLVRGMARAVVVAATGVFTLVVWAEHSSDMLERELCALVVLAGALSIAIPALQRLGRGAGVD